MKKSKAWGMFIVLYLACLAIGLCQFKVPPIMPVLAEAFNVSMTSVAWLSNIFYVTGIILAIPGAFILNKLGPKKTGIGILLFLVVGGILGVISKNFSLMLFSRFVEGIGFSFGTMLGIVLINQWFEPKTASVATGIFSTFPAFGAMIMLSFGATWASLWGWEVLWYISIIYSVIMIFAFGIFITAPTVQPQGSDAQGPVNVISIEGLKNGRALILGICLGCAIFVMLAFSNLYFTIFTEFYGLSVQSASFYAGLTGFLGIICCILSGILVSRTGKPIIIIGVSFILLAVTCFFTFMLKSNMGYLLHVVSITLFTNLIIPAVLCTVPLTAKRPEFISMAMGLTNEIYFIGSLLSAPVVTAVIEKQGWSAARIPLIIVCLIGLAFCAIYTAINKKEEQARISA